ncbi:MAG: tetratricopeptide repeat protein, partial [Nitrospinae bacterium]|nr:tetratricopeptide repeat protein [Nitrospinota bacterium]
KELKADPDNIDLQIELATLMIDGANYEEAIKQLLAIRNKAPKNARVYKLLGTAYVLFNHEEEALIELNRACELDPNDPENHFNLGGLLLRDMFTNAADSFEKVIELDPTDTTGYANLAAAYDMLKLYDKEIIALRKVLMFNPEDKELRAALSNAYFHAQRYEEAIDAALCVVDVDDKDPQAYCNLGSCYSVRNMVDDAIASFKKASELAPDYSLPHTNLGTLYANMGRPEAAIKSFKTAVSLNPADAGAWFSLYNCYKEVGLMDDSQEAYKKYEALMNEPEPVATEGGDNPANIPGGVSQTSKYAGGGSMEGNAPGMESLADADDDPR